MKQISLINTGLSYFLLVYDQKSIELQSQFQVFVVNFIDSDLFTKPYQIDGNWIVISLTENPGIVNSDCQVDDKSMEIQGS